MFNFNFYRFFAITARNLTIRLFTVGLLLACSSTFAFGEAIHIAVAANFAAPIKMIAEKFEASSDYKVTLSVGSTGKFYTQIKNGAPFDIFLAADNTTPLKLETEKATVPGSRFTYAIGKLVLWSAKPGFVDDKGNILYKQTFHHLAIAAPKLAPYGAAAVETLKSMTLFTALEPKLVQGENIGQAYQFIASGNAELGFVALSQVFKDGKIQSGSAWIVPADKYKPIKQDAVILARAKDNAAATAFMTFLQSEAARAVIRSYGYAY